ncbi:MAG: arylsulfatase A-like enzyme [Candidatus Binatia bacterium]|jgi:arylsulfatase A-like enzyme
MRFLKQLLFLSLLFALPALSVAAKRPNILFIFTDDHCQQAISAYGSNRIKTPGMDRIAHEGMMFDRCYVNNSICGPSRAVIQTGKYSHLNGFVRNGNYFNGAQQTFPKLLRKAGYQTAVVGKWHLASTPQGFDYYDVLVGQGPYYNPPMKTAGTDGQPVVKKHTGYTTHIITEKSLGWLRDQRDPDKPFMLMYQHKAPHRNWQPGPNYLTMYDDVVMPEPETLWDDYLGRSKAVTYQKMEVANHLNPKDLKLTAPNNLTPDQKQLWDAAYDPKNKAFEAAKLSGKALVKWKYQRYVKDYLRCVKAVDDDINRVLAYLDEAGLADNTIVMYSSDQGWYLGEHGWFDKRWMYEESLKTPLLVRWPGVINPGTRSGAIVSNLDFAETFLDVAGVTVPDDMQGHSLAPIFKGQGKAPSDWRKSFYYHYYEGLGGGHSVPRHYGVTTGEHKLINFYEVGEWEFFDLKKDPNELTSFYGDPKYAKVQTKMENELARLRKFYKVPEEDPAGDPNPNRRQRKGKNKGKGGKKGKGKK